MCIYLYIYLLRRRLRAPVSEDDKTGARRAAAHLAKDLAAAAPDVFSAHATVLLPLAWLGHHDEDAEVAQAWGGAWEEGATSTYEAVMSNPTHKQ